MDLAAAAPLLAKYVACGTEEQGSGGRRQGLDQGSPPPPSCPDRVTALQFNCRIINFLLNTNFCCCPHTFEQHHSTLPPQNISSKKTLAHGASQGEELCHWPDGHTAAQTLCAGIWPGGERKRLSQLLNSLHPSPKQATHTSAVIHKHHALGKSTKDTSDDTCPVHRDLEWCLKCSQLPSETTSLTEQGLALNQLSKFHFFKSICTSRTCTHITTCCSSLPNKHLLKSCVYYTHYNPIKGLRSHQQWHLWVFLREDCLEGELLSVAFLEWRKRHFISLIQKCIT